MCIGAEICESEYEEYRNRYYNDFDEYDFEQCLYEKNFKEDLDNMCPNLTYRYCRKLYKIKRIISGVILNK